MSDKLQVGPLRGRTRELIRVANILLGIDANRPEEIRTYFHAIEARVEDIGSLIYDGDRDHIRDEKLRTHP